MDEWGHVKLSRKFFEEGGWWLRPRVFSHAEAWIDCIQMAAWKDRPYMIGAEVFQLQRGQFVASIRFLADRWRWGKHKVEKFLEVAQKGGQLRGHPRGQQSTVYVLLNYELYQGVGKNGGHPRGHPRGHGGDKTEAVKAIKEEKTPQLDPVDHSYNAVIAHYRSRHPRRMRGEVPSKTARLLRKALENYTGTELQRAIDNNAASEFHRKGNHMGLELILRDSEHIDRFIGLTEPAADLVGVQDEPKLEWR